jgi:hypothetical protein
MTEPRDLLLDTEPKDLLLVIERLRRSNRRWKALALAACAVVILVGLLSAMWAQAQRMRAEAAMREAIRAEQLARQNAELARAQAQRAANPGQPR